MALASYSISTPWLQIWHERMGHLGEQNLLKLKGMSYGTSDIPEACLCEACVLGRMKEGSHKVPFKPAIYSLEFINTDFAGPFPVPGNKGARYWVTFLVAKTRRAYSHPISKRTNFTHC